MDNTGVLLSWLLGIAVLLPLASFVLILVFGPLMGKGGRQAGVCATGAILSSCVLSFVALGDLAGPSRPGRRGAWRARRTCRGHGGQAEHPRRARRAMHADAADDAC